MLTLFGFQHTRFLKFKQHPIYGVLKLLQLIAEQIAANHW